MALKEQLINLREELSATDMMLANMSPKEIFQVAGSNTNAINKNLDDVFKNEPALIKSKFRHIQLDNTNQPIFFNNTELKDKYTHWVKRLLSKHADEFTEQEVLDEIRIYNEIYKNNSDWLDLLAALRLALVWKPLFNKKAAHSIRDKDFKKLDYFQKTGTPHLPLQTTDLTPSFDFTLYTGETLNGKPLFLYDKDLVSYYTRWYSALANPDRPNNTEEEITDEMSEVASVYARTQPKVWNSLIDAFLNEKNKLNLPQSFIDWLINGAKEKMKEAVESSKEIIANNTVPGFEQMGMANVVPGEFAQEEITDKENLVNTADMSNDTDFNKDCDHCCDITKQINDILADVVDISAPEADDKDDDTVKIMHAEITQDAPFKGFGHSGMAKIIESVLGGKSSEAYLKSLHESDYAGPLSYVPDLRINATDVLKALKNEIGDGSEALHVDADIDDRKNKIYKVSMIAKEKLPKTIQVENVKLVLDGDTYKTEEPSKDYPLAK